MADNPKGRGPSVMLIPDGDTRERQVCPDCGFINYVNPKIVVGSVVTWEDRILLCRRAIDPRRGLMARRQSRMRSSQTQTEPTTTLGFS